MGGAQTSAINLLISTLGGGQQHQSAGYAPPKRCSKRVLIGHTTSAISVSLLVGHRGLQQAPGCDSGRGLEASIISLLAERYRVIVSFSVAVLIADVIV